MKISCNKFYSTIECCFQYSCQASIFCLPSVVIIISLTYMYILVIYQPAKIAFNCQSDQVQCIMNPSCQLGQATTRNADRTNPITVSKYPAEEVVNSFSPEKVPKMHTIHQLIEFLDWNMRCWPQAQHFWTEDLSNTIAESY